MSRNSKRNVEQSQLILDIVDTVVQEGQEEDQHAEDARQTQRTATEASRGLFCRTQLP